MKQRLLIVEPSEVIVEGLKTILESQSRFKLLEPEVSADHIEERIIASHPDVVLINPTLLNKSVSSLRSEYHVAVVALVYQYVEREVLKGYDGAAEIRDGRTVIIDTLARASPVASQPTQTHYEPPPRETAVLIQLAQGKTNKEVAEALNVSVHTVISHRKNITRKTGIKSVAGLTVYAMLNNLIDESALL